MESSAEVKACPLLSQVVMRQSRLGAPEPGLVGINCTGDKCAWWHKSDKQCAVVSTADWMKRFASTSLLESPAKP